MIKTRPFFLTLALAVLAFTVPRVFAAPAYTYTSVIDSSGALKEFDSYFPSINNKGVVVFHAKFPAGDGQPAGEGIYVTDGSSYRGIAVTGGVYTGFHANPSINDKGFAVFQAEGPNNSEGIFVGDGKTVGNKTIATSNSGRLYQFSLITRFSDYGPALDEQGNAVFSANQQTTRQRALFAGDGSKIETQLDAPVPDTSPAVNASGTVAYLASDGAIKRTTVTGAAAVTIATPAGDSPFESFEAVSINNAGVVAFTAKLKAGGYGVYTADGNGAPTLVVNTTTQPSFTRFRSVSINNTGSVAFGADFASGGSNIVVFGPTGGKVVLTSDLFGSTVTGFYSTITPRALNDLGQVVFWYQLANGKQGIAVATPSNGVEARTLGNISTRLKVLPGDNALIGGFIITGTAPKKVIIRGLGPSLGIAGALQDPTLQLFQGAESLATNDNWQQDQAAEIQATGIPPSNAAEAAIVRTLPVGTYTAVLRGKDNGAGIGLVEVYDLAQQSGSQLANISSRGFIGTGDGVLIGGFIVGPYTKTVVRALGPSLPASLGKRLADPTLQIVDGHGAVVAANNNWRETQEAEIKAIGIQPAKDKESTIITTLQSGSYTAVVRGVNNSTGIGLVEVYNLR